MKLLTSLAKGGFLILFLILSNINIFAQKAVLGTEFKGKASFYHIKFDGRRTASGHRFYNYKYTCAHKSLPFGTMIEVTNVNSGKSVVVRVNDRGPFVKGRVLDLSTAAAKKIGLRDGVIRIHAKIVGFGSKVNAITKTDFIEQDEIIEEPVYKAEPKILNDSAQYGLDSIILKVDKGNVKVSHVSPKKSTKVKKK